MSATCNLITGFLGTGKTTLIRHLLAQRPPGERWAVIVNEFGVVGIDGTTLTAASDTAGAASPQVQVREVAGGCICCAANVPLRVAITEVLRRLRPDRLLVEPSGLGHPAAILSTLAEPGLAGALRIGAVLCVVDPRHPLPGECDPDPLDDLWIDQLSIAEVVVANKRDLVTDARLRAFANWIRTLYPPKHAVVPAIEGDVPLELLDTPRARWRYILEGGHDVAGTVHIEPPVSIAGVGTRHVAWSNRTLSVGWLFDDPDRQAAVLHAGRIDRLLMRLATLAATNDLRLLRAKGALRTDHGTRLVEWSTGQVRSSPLAFQGPGRFELLCDGTGAAHSASSIALAATIEALLVAAAGAEG